MFSNPLKFTVKFDYFKFQPQKTFFIKILKVNNLNI
jgi:hypothetical protein